MEIMQYLQNIENYLKPRKKLNIDFSRGTITEFCGNKIIHRTLLLDEKGCYYVKNGKKQYIQSEEEKEM